MPAFKDEFSTGLIDDLGQELIVAWPDFPLARWRRLAHDGLEQLELMQRVTHLASALRACLPDEFASAAELIARLPDRAEFDGWMMLPVGYYVSDAGLDDPERSLPLLAAITSRFSSEGPIRPFIEHHPEVTFRYLHAWISDPDEHVRRLVSEGTRPRLPWAPQLKAIKADPSPILPLLDALFDDDREYVRRSVANNLNDISKDHPALAVEVAQRWASSTTHGVYVIRHGLRTLVKRGDPDALALLGFDHESDVELVELTVSPSAITIGEEVTLSATLRTEQEVRAVIDYVVHYQGVNGVRSGKVFKLTTRTISPGTPTLVRKRHRFEPVSIRTIHPGTHRMELQVNGRVLGSVEVEVAAPAG
jgi:3-methyladenine DNA glycosylase AlkC